ncbi:MAG: SDR family NAD(P)-dependent oxidoreductase [Candidatus Aminicenantes bacterium]|nr:SDR family NAD(P)-dependent oxidoreductase [Candidatus Aminicenantes bacterium]
MSEIKLPFVGPALITGASSGLGEEFARRLAAMGHSLILVARREDKLRALASELIAAHGVQADVVVADLASEQGIVKVEEVLRSRGDVALLVNNAGFGAGGSFYRIDMAIQTAMIRVHVEAAARLMRAALPSMVERGVGAVVNVASVAAFTISPKSAMYASTKAWTVSFSRALALELRPKGVRVQVLCPGFTHTGFHSTPEFATSDGIAIPRFLWGPADKVVGASLTALRGHRIVVIPGWKNKIMARLARMSVATAVIRAFTRKRV